MLKRTIGWLAISIVMAGCSLVFSNAEPVADDCADVSCDSGQRCEAGVCVCDALSCASGCCSGDTCNDPRSEDACGPPGQACFSCGLSADGCSGGLCECGVGGPACGPGQECQNGLCVCTEASCGAGCCDGATCRTRDFATCGVGGASCSGCEAQVANNCSANGDCQCGNGEICAVGQRCESGSCVCDDISCPDGCCDDQGACQLGLLSDQCGTAGQACTDCVAEDLGTCAAGVCSGCAEQCQDGCCTGATCIEPPNSATCGTNGGVCSACGITSDSCVDGECSCGALGPCAEGQQCLNGVCECNTNSCPDGCCDSGGQCQPSSDTSCGIAGASCETCPAQERCDIGQCVCDSTSCGGCCGPGSDTGDCQPGTEITACGVGGILCVDCNKQIADSCDPDFGCSCGPGQPACVPGQICDNGTCVCNDVSCADGCCTTDNLCAMNLDGKPCTVVVDP